MGEGVAPAVGMVDPKFPLYDRHAKRVRAGLELPNGTTSMADFDEPDHMADAVGVTWGEVAP